MSWALVTGASKGIGAAIAENLASAGRDVCIHYGRDEDGAKATAERCETHGVSTRIVGADLRQGIDPLVEVLADLGGIDVLVNNAGMTADGLSLSMSDEQFALPWEVNTAAAFSLCRAALRGMLRRRSGRIVNISSVIGLHGNAGQANYAASKAALIAVTKTLAREVGKRGITVNAVAPGFIETAMTDDVDSTGFLARIPAARLGTPQEVAAAVGFLCSDGAAYVNGAVIVVDGGLFA